MLNRHSLGVRCATAVVALALGTSEASAGSVAGFGGATEVTQILNNTQLIQQAATMAQQLNQMITTVQYLQQQLVNLQDLPDLNWGYLSSDLAQLANVVSQGQALGYQLENIDSRFQDLYSGFQSPLQVGYANKAQQWTQTTLDSLNSALRVAGMQANQFSSEQSALSAMQKQATNAKGALAMAKVGAQVANQQSAQLMKLRQLTMAEMSAQNAYFAMEATRHGRDDGATTAHFDVYTPKTPTFSSQGGKH